MISFGEKRVALERLSKMFHEIADGKKDADDIRGLAFFIDVMRAENEQGYTNHSGDEKTPPEGRTESERAILPIPCTVGFDDWTVKQCFQKINEELDELKEQVSGSLTLNEKANYYKQNFSCVEFSHKKRIADEAADTITAITSMLDAMGIDEQMRQDAQRRVNERNRERGRTDND